MQPVIVDSLQQAASACPVQASQLSSGVQQQLLGQHRGVPAGSKCLLQNKPARPARPARETDSICRKPWAKQPGPKQPWAKQPRPEKPWDQQPRNRELRHGVLRKYSLSQIWLLIFRGQLRAVTIQGRITPDRGCTKDVQVVIGKWEMGMFDVRLESDDV